MTDEELRKEAERIAVFALRVDRGTYSVDEDVILDALRSVREKAILETRGLPDPERGSVVTKAVFDAIAENRAQARREARREAIESALEVLRDHRRKNPRDLHPLCCSDYLIVAVEALLEPKEPGK